MSINISDKHAQTVEELIENLDNRGLLVFQILLGQQAMKLLTEEKEKEVTKTSRILSPDAENIRTISIPTQS